MKIGFTGTDVGMTEAQISTLYYDLLIPKPVLFEFHHGDCIGADTEAADLAEMAGGTTISHPPEDPKKRAWHNSGTILPPKEYLKRNHDIVDATEILIATPRGTAEEVRSGTWATIRYALKRDKPVTIIWPNGSSEIWRK